MEEIFEVWSRISWSETQALWAQMVEVAGDGARVFLEHCFHHWPALERADLVTAGMDRHRLAREWTAFQVEHPLVLGPALTHPPFEVGFDVSDVDGAVETTRRMRFFMVANVVGLPSVALPVGVKSGVPQGFR